MPPRFPVFDPTQPLPRLTLDQSWGGNRLTKPGLMPGKLALDPAVEDRLHQMAAPGIVIGTALTFPSAALDEIKSKFRPKTAAGEMGCMKACYNVLAILFTAKVSTELRQEVYRRARAQAEAFAKRNPETLKARIAEAKAANPKLTDAQARWNAIDQMTSPYNDSDRLFALMGERGLADPKVNSPNAQAEQAIRNLTGDGPGVYFFGLAVRDNHTVTLAVERAADGSQKMFWLDQNNPGLRTEIKSGQLGATLQNVQGHTNSTNIYPFRPPSGTGTP
jgi:hypothetical protein